jgi:hypothetical protein
MPREDMAVIGTDVVGKDLTEDSVKVEKLRVVWCVDEVAE